MVDDSIDERSGIGTLSERSLHADLIRRVAQAGDRFEVRRGRFVIDIVRGERLIEVQTRHLHSMANKVDALLPTAPIEVLFPIAERRWIVREEVDGTPVGRRRSPKKATPFEIFAELARVPSWIGKQGLTLRLLLIEDEQVLRNDGLGSWRQRGWSRADRRLVEVRSERALQCPADYLELLPSDLAEPFTNRHLSERVGCPVRLAGQATYALRRAGLLEVVGKEGNARCFRKVPCTSQKR